MLKKFMLVLAIVLIPFANANARAIKVDLNLKSIEAEILSEKGGDELYFAITTYSGSKKPVFSRIPDFPAHWLSKHLPKIKDISLWNGNLKDGERVQLIVSLIEHDAPPWNVDDHIGSVKLTLFNKNGILVKKWGQPTYRDQPKVSQIKNSRRPAFIMTGDGSRYKVMFDLKY